MLKTPPVCVSLCVCVSPSVLQNSLFLQLLAINLPLYPAPVSPSVFPPLPELFLSFLILCDSAPIYSPPATFVSFLRVWVSTAPLAVLQEDEFIIIIITMLIPEAYLPK